VGGVEWARRLHTDEPPADWTCSTQAIPDEDDKWMVIAQGPCPTCHGLSSGMTTNLSAPAGHPASNAEVATDTKVGEHVDVRGKCVCDFHHPKADDGVMGCGTETIVSCEVEAPT
jgi:hypothetical protein